MFCSQSDDFAVCHGYAAVAIAAGLILFVRHDA
jgi:hypothetical protein